MNTPFSGSTIGISRWRTPPDLVIFLWRGCGLWGQWPVHSGSHEPEMPPPSFASSGGSTGMVP